MQISKSLFVVCAAAVVIPFSANAADTPAQAKARQALEQKYREMGVQPAPGPAHAPATPAAAPAQAAPRQSAPTQAVTKSARPQPAPTPAPPAADSETIAKAREALRQKMAQVESESAQQRPGAATMPGFSELPPERGLQGKKLDEARDAVDRQVQAMEQETLTAKEPATTRAREADLRSTPAPLRGMRDYEALQGPALPFTPEQQQKLAELLRRYRADEITPEQYHAERARIIAGK